MSDIDLSPPQRDLLREKLYKYCQENFELELGDAANLLI